VAAKTSAQIEEKTVDSMADSFAMEVGESSQCWRGRRSGVTLNLMRNEKRERSRTRGRRRGRRRRNEQLTLNLVKSPSRNDGGSSGISEPGGDEVDGWGGRRGDVTRSRHLSGQFLLKPVHLRLHLPHLGVRQVRHRRSRSSLVKDDRRMRLL